MALPLGVLRYVSIIEMRSFHDEFAQTCFPAALEAALRTRMLYLKTWSLSRILGVDRCPRIDSATLEIRDLGSQVPHDC